jgi:hypothetical protein
MTLPYRAGARVPGPLGSPTATGGRIPGPIGRILWDKQTPSSSGTAVKAPKREGTQVLYVPPHAPKPETQGGIDYSWSFYTKEGRQEYEAALKRHLQDNKLLSGDVSFSPLSSVEDIGVLASGSTDKLILIVHGAGDAPAIAVHSEDAADGTKADWMKVGKFAEKIARFGFSNITILGCDSVSNHFAPLLAAILPTGSTVTGHDGGSYIIKPHFEFSKEKGHLKLTRLKSNLNLTTFRTTGKSP